jgi:hypothetical protein
MDPVMIGEYTGTTTATYTLNIVSGSIEEGSLSGVSFVWNKNGGAFSAPVVALGEGNLLSDGMTVTWMHGGAQNYVVGYGWTIVVSGMADIYDDLQDDGSIVHRAVAVDASAPSSSVASLRLRKVRTDGTKVSSVTPLALTNTYLKSYGIQLGNAFIIKYNTDTNTLDIVGGTV